MVQVANQYASSAGSNRFPEQMVTITKVQGGAVDSKKMGRLSSYSTLLQPG